MLDTSRHAPHELLFPVALGALPRADAFAWNDLGPLLNIGPAARHDVRRTPDRPPALAPARCPAASADAEPLRLIELIRSRNESALRKFHAKFQPRVFACAMAIVRREEVANEVVSAAFMQVWTTAGSYDPQRGPVIAWLLLIARSRSLDAMRHARVFESREVSIDDELCSREFAGDCSVEPLAHLERSHRKQRLGRAMLRLSPIQRQVLSLTTMDGLSQDEASHHLDLPLGTVKSHARRGLAALKARCEAIGLTTG